ncbi:MAG: ribosome biogenesis GTP-binding protein YihA/YsxC [Candidatus Amulumruptor caecigallinarius]|nr:ribosome biogenesis GTP-binding protein YihA/YsxC [Candidatus Amulumruptor caecigallinarius]
MDIKPRTLSARYEISSPDVKKCPDTNVPEYAFIGRSNVGKSSLINMLGMNKKLAKTSQLPGKTLLINHFKMEGGKWYLVDLPGYGYAARGKQQRDQLEQMINSYVLQRRQLTCLFVLIDIRHSPQKIDMEFIDWLGENNVPFALVFTKADKLGPVARKRNVDAYMKELSLSWEELPPYFVTSSEKSIGRDELLDYITSINEELAGDKERRECVGKQSPNNN